MKPELPRWSPRSLQCLRGYTRQLFVADLIAGLTVGCVALPLAMAFGIASGVTPQAGIYTAIIAGFLISALGGSRTQIGGPTGAFIILVSSIVAQFGMSGLLMVTSMVGCILLVMGFTGLGSAVKFLPRPVTIGFTNGIALLIASTQIKDFLGLRTTQNPGEFLQRMKVIWASLGTMQWTSLLLAAGSLLVMLILPRITKKVPGAIITLLGATILTVVTGLHVETIGTKFGGIPSGLPHFAVPEFRGDLILPLLPSAFTVAMLAAVESLLSAVVADNMTGDKHNSNTELVAQGVANLATPFFGGIPATGAIARTATNIRSGAHTPVAGVIHAVTLLAILMVAAPLAAYIPLATLAAVLLVVSYNMGEWREIRPILRLSRADIAVWLATFSLTVFADLTIAVEVGLALAALLYIHRVSQTTTVSTVTQGYIDDGRPHILQDKAVPPYVSILRIHGPFLFGTTEKLAEETADLAHLKPIVILRLRNMPAIDATGVHALEKLAGQLRKAGKILIICGARQQPAQILKQSGFSTYIGMENIQPHLEAALARAREISANWEGIEYESPKNFQRQLA